MSLVVLNGEAEGQRCRLRAGLVIGRSSDADMSLADFKASRFHARFERLDTGFEVVDLDSHNGVLLNGQRVETARIDHGDVLQIGRTEIGVVELRCDGLTPLLASSSLASGDVRRWSPDTPPSVASMDSREFLQALGIAAPADSSELADSEFARLLNKTRNFAVLHELAGNLDQAQGLDTVLSMTLTYLFWVVNADRGYVLLRDPDSQQLVPVLARHRDPDQADDPLEVSQTIIDYVVRERTAVVSPDAALDDRFGDSPSTARRRIGSVLCLPLIDNEGVIGVIQLDCSAPGDCFSSDDLELLQVMSSFLGVRIRNARLYEELRAQLDALRAANDERCRAQSTLIEAERMAIIGRLSAGMAHEIHNWTLPLASAERLRERSPEDRELLDFVDRVAEARDGIAALVDELWRLSKDLPPELELELSDPAATLEAAIRVARCDPDVRRHRIERRFEPVPPVPMDENRILRVFINLLRNAGQAMESPGLIEVLLAPDDTDGAWVQLAVRDEGPGIAPELLPHIWERFFTTKGECGMGLGLDICRRITQAHGGRIECDSLLGRGTTVTVRLPI